MRKVLIFGLFFALGGILMAADMRIKLTNNNKTIIFLLNESPQSRAFYSQLPIKVSLQNYSTNEKIFSLEKRLPLENGIERGGKSGEIAYFSPWGNVAIYYGDFSQYRGLFVMGKAVEGGSLIADLEGEALIEQINAY